MTAWMIYAVVATAATTAAALALEYGLRGRGVALRWVWIAAMAGSVVLCLLPWVSPGADSSNEPSARTSAPADVVLGAATLSPREPFGGGAPSAQFGSFERLTMPTVPELDQASAVVAGILAALGLTVFIGSSRRIARRRRNWRATTIEGVPALVSRSIGPAVVGYLNPAIVLPGWVVGMDDDRRRLVILHEQEHLEAKDNHLLGLATLVVMLIPWNAALWLQLRRLRQAVELDCDRRVLARTPDPEVYGELLIEMGQRASTRGYALAAFAESSSFLERRIRSIVTSKPRRARLLLGACAAPLLASLPLAWELPSPRRIDVEASGISPAPAFEAPLARRPRVEELVSRDYPEIYSSGLATDRAIWFAIDRDGQLRRSWIGPNLYVSLGAAGNPLAEFDLAEGSVERQAAVAEHQRREQEVLQANVPDLAIQSIYAGYFSGGGGSAVVHFVTEDAGAGNWGRFRVASAFVADAIDVALAR